MASSAGEKGGVFASLRRRREWATSSTSPVGMLGLARPSPRLRRTPVTAMTYSGRAASALAWASGETSLSRTTWVMPVRSRRPRKMRLPWSRRRLTQPMRGMVWPGGVVRSPPEVCVRWSVPRKSRVTILLLYESLLCEGLSAAIFGAGRQNAEGSVAARRCVSFPDSFAIREGLDLGVVAVEIVAQQHHLRAGVPRGVEPWIPEDELHVLCVQLIDGACGVFRGHTVAYVGGAHEYGVAEPHGEIDVGPRGLEEELSRGGVGLEPAQLLIGRRTRSGGAAGQVE